MDKLHIKNIIFSKSSRKLMAIQPTIMEVTQFQEDWWIIHALHNVKVVTAFVDGESDLLPSLIGSLLATSPFPFIVIKSDSSEFIEVIQPRKTHEEKTSAFKQPQEF